MMSFDNEVECAGRTQGEMFKRPGTKRNLVKREGIPEREASSEQKEDLSKFKEHIRCFHGEDSVDVKGLGEGVCHTHGFGLPLLSQMGP